MIIDNFKCNIPNITVNKVVDSLVVLYENAINQQIIFKSLPTPFLWGAAGIGKSQGVYQLAEKLQKKLAQFQSCIVVRRFYGTDNIKTRGNETRQYPNRAS